MQEIQLTSNATITVHENGIIDITIISKVPEKQSVTMLMQVSGDDLVDVTTGEVLMSINPATNEGLSHSVKGAKA